jgi:hypothetical protein
LQSRMCLSRPAERLEALQHYPQLVLCDVGNVEDSQDGFVV